jgi:hypothetical protein
MSNTSQPLMGTVKYKEGLDFRKILNQSLNVFFKDAVRVAVTKMGTRGNSCSTDHDFQHHKQM